MPRVKSIENNKIGKIEKSITTSYPKVPTRSTVHILNSHVSYLQYFLKKISGKKLRKRVGCIHMGGHFVL